MTSIKQNIKLAFTQNKWPIIFSFLILICSILLGYYLEAYLYDYLNPVVDALVEQVQSGALQITFHDIFLNNIKVVLLSFILGIFCCISVLILAFNGLFLGYYVGFRGDVLGTAVYIIPHGIFELSSCILACASGIVLFKFLYTFFHTYYRQNGYVHGNRWKNAFDLSFDTFKQAVILLVIAAILMAIAGFIEAYLTIPIGDFLISVLR